METQTGRAISNLMKVANGRVTTFHRSPGERSTHCRSRVLACLAAILSICWGGEAKGITINSTKFEISGDWAESW